MQKILFVLRVARERGLRFFFIYFMQSIWFDLRYGTSTSARVPKEDQNIEGTSSERENGLLYVASFTSVVRNTLDVTRAALGDEAFARAQFFDLGCGKGKTMLAYALYMQGRGQQHQAVGIEYDPALTDLALENLRRFTGLAPDEVDIAIVNDSAVNVRQYASGKYFVVYLYNSFQGETLRAVLAELAQLPHRLIYVDPVERESLLDFGYEIEHEHQGLYHADTWLTAVHPGS